MEVCRRERKDPTIKKSAIPISKSETNDAENKPKYEIIPPESARFEFFPFWSFEFVSDFELRISIQTFVSFASFVVKSLTIPEFSPRCREKSAPSTHPSNPIPATL